MAIHSGVGDPRAPGYAATTCKLTHFYWPTLRSGAAICMIANKQSGLAQARHKESKNSTYNWFQHPLLTNLHSHGESLLMLLPFANCQAGYTLYNWQLLFVLPLNPGSRPNSDQARLIMLSTGPAVSSSGAASE